MNIYIRDIFDALKNSIPTIENTVDKLIFGDPDSTVRGIAVAYLATQEVIEKSKELGVNLIITHEGIFYSHRDRHEILKSDPVYIKKCQTIEESNMAILRLHDYVHRYMPDGIMAGLLHTLGWQDYEVVSRPISSIVEIPQMSLHDVIIHVKNCLGIKYVRFIGDTAMLCRRIGLLVGYRGSGELVIPFFEKENLDLVIYGEGPEWETPEYVRDAIRQGRRKALIVLGHAESEAPGMEYIARMLQAKFPGVPVHFIPQGQIFQIL